MGMILVYGGGFGLYGHTAALASLNAQVATLKRYMPEAEKRAEIRPFIPKIHWTDSLSTLPSRPSAVVLAQRPLDNEARGRFLLQKNIGGLLVFEKPMARSWRQAQDLESALADNGRAWTVPYLFLCCDWFEDLEKNLRSGAPQFLTWSHRQSSGLRLWKNSRLEGGGIIAFYFLHCLAVLEALVPGAEVRYSRMYDGGSTRISASATNGERTLTIQFILGNEAYFKINTEKVIWHWSETPFGNSFQPGRPDPRISVLCKFYEQELLQPKNKSKKIDFLQKVTSRWRDLEGQIGEI